MLKILSKLTIAFMAVALGVSIPARYAPAMAAGETKYISEIRVGIGKTEDEAKSELLSDGYTILSKDGKYADLNYEAGSKDPTMGRGQKIVYLGYKTTTSVKDAITDLAVMNMRGGYSVKDYEELMEKRLRTEIIPFVERFIVVLEEYRDNLSSEYPANKARAEYMRSMLNKMFDDDTLGLMGDLLVNETKYELGDAAYAALSEEEKKQHADILTIVMQANGKNMLSMETFLTKATDTAETSWIDRLEDNSLGALEYELVNEQGVDVTEVDATLDRMYQDSARQLLEKWDAFSQALSDFDDIANALANIQEDEYNDKIAKMEQYDDSSDNMAQNSEAIVAELSARADVMNNALDFELVAAKERMDEVDYDFDNGATLAEFFAQDASVFNGDGIRDLYPIVASLSAGQLAGLDFLSLQDLVTIATADETSYDLNELGDVAPASIYEGVNREIFTTGKVALTSEALRAEAMKNDAVSDSPVSATTYVLYGATAIATIGMVASWYKFKQLSDLMQPTIKLRDAAFKAYEAAALKPDALNEQVMAGKMSCWEYQVEVQKLYDAQADTVRALNAKNMDEALDKIDEALSPHLTKSRIAAVLGAAFTVAMAALAAFSIYSTINDLLAYYQVEYTPIPKYMVEKESIVEVIDGVEYYKRNDSAYYQVAECNRKSDAPFYEQLQNYADLNGDVGRQWLALYYVKYEGKAPIQADTLKVVIGDSNLPNGYERGIHMFGNGGAYNLTNKDICYNDTNKGTYVYFQVDESVIKTASLAGSNFSTGSAVLFAGIGAVVGAGIGIAVMFLLNKRKETKAAQE